MANKTITQLDAAQSLNDNMVIAVQDTNTTYKTTLADVKAYCGGGAQIEAANNTNSAISEGDKVWINKDIQNTSITGSPEINYQTNSVTNFSNSNYLSVLEKFNPSTSDWECQIKITTGSVDTGEQCIVSNTQEMKGIRIAITNTGKFEFLVAGSNGWIDISSFRGSYTCLANTTYWIKAGYSKDNNQYYLLYSLDGAQYYNDISYSPSSIDNKIIAPCDITFGNGPTIGGSIIASSFSGTIHFSDTYISVDKYYWYKPILEDNNTNYINDYTLHTYNISSHGFPSAVQGVVNRTSSSSYYTSNKPISYSNSDAWEIGMSWKWNSLTAGSGYVLSFGYYYSGLYIATSTNSFGVAIGNGSSWMGSIKDNVVTPSKERIWVKVVHNGTGMYYVLWSTDGVNYTKTEDVQIGTAALTNKYLHIGQCDSDVPSFEYGNIFLEDCYVKVNNEEVWRGYTKTNEIIAPESAQTGTAAENIAAGATGLVNVGAVIEPTGSITITTNGTHDVADYAEAIVNVTGGSEYTCLNTTGSNISEGEKVYIASNTNLSLIPYSSFTSLGYTGIAAENITNGSSGSVKSYMLEPSQGLNLWDRVDGKGTVAGFFTDGNGDKYAVVVADAAYRTGGQGWNSNYGSLTDTPLPNYGSSSAALAATESATFNMDTIRSNYGLSTYPAFNSSYSKSLTFDGVTYNGLLPNAAELQMIFTNREYLDTLDTSLADYPSNSLMTWNIGGNSSSRCWSSTEQSASSAWYLGSDGAWGNYNDKVSSYGIIPVFEIPVED